MCHADGLQNRQTRHNYREIYRLEMQVPRKIFVCLANSFKNGGNCVAGIEIVEGGFGAWIRPVSLRAGRALNYVERSYANNEECALLDVIEADFDRHQPDGYQSENWLIANGSRWRKLGAVSAADVAPVIHDGTRPLWPHTGSTRGGKHDSINAANLGALTNSLALVKPQQCEFSVAANIFKNNKLDVRAIFAWGGQENNLKVTDPKVCHKLQARGVGKYQLQDATMCISVGEVFAARNEAYKLVTSVLQ